MLLAIKIPLQIIVGAAFWLLVIGLSQAPSYTYSDPALAQIKVSIIHASKPVGECRRLTAVELAELPPNMRKPSRCPRERHPVYLELSLDGQTILSSLAQPSGLYRDGPASIYDKFEVTPGKHFLIVKMRDSGIVDGFDYIQEIEIELDPAQNFVVNFDSAEKVFRLK